MTRRISWQISLALSLIVVIGASSVFGMDPTTKRALRLQALNLLKFSSPAMVLSDAKSSEDPMGAPPAGQYIGATEGAFDIPCVVGSDPASDAIRGITQGCTYYEYQGNNSLGRQIGSRGTDHIINFVWMNQDVPLHNGGRNVRYNAYDPGTGNFLGQSNVGTPPLLPDRSGYVNMDVRPDGKVVITHHLDANFGGLGAVFRPQIYVNGTPAVDDFTQFEIPDALYDTVFTGDGEQLIWPKVAFTDDGLGVEVIHVVVMTDQTTEPDGLNYYIRNASPAINSGWENPRVAHISGYGTSVILQASRKPGSQRVGIATAGGRSDGVDFNTMVPRSNGLGSGQIDNDMYVTLSDDAGVTWSGGGGPLTGALPWLNLTRRPDSLSSDEAAAALLPQDASRNYYASTKHTALFDESDKFHVIIMGGLWGGYTVGSPTGGRFLHWSEDNDPAVDAKLRAVYDFSWSQSVCSPAVFELNASGPQLSSCDGKLYTTFAMFNNPPGGVDDDCGARCQGGTGDCSGAANGDLWVTVSINNGANWDDPRNLTDTYTPNCDQDGSTGTGTELEDCDADNWPSVIRYGLDLTLDITDFASIPDLTAKLDGSYSGFDYLFVGYMNDADPGGAIRPEGTWQLVPVRTFRFGCVQPILEARLIHDMSIDPDYNTGVRDPAFTRPGEDSTINWRIENVGNTSIPDYSITIINDLPVGNVTITGNPLTGALSENTPNFLDFVVTLNAGLESTPQNAKAEIVISGTFKDSPKSFLIEYCICDLATVVDDSLESNMIYGNDGNIGRSGNSSRTFETAIAGGLNLDFQGQPFEVDTVLGSASWYLYAGSPFINYSDANGYHFASQTFGSGIVDTFKFRPLEATPIANSTQGDYEHGGSGVFTIQDSSVCMSVDYWHPNAGLMPAGDGVTNAFDAVIVRVCWYQSDGAVGDRNLVLGYGLDWDVPGDSGKNTSDAILDIPKRMFGMYQQGAEYGQDTGVSSVTPNNKRWAALVWCPAPAGDAIAQSDGSGTGAQTIDTFQAIFARDDKTILGALGWRNDFMDSVTSSSHADSVTAKGYSGITGLVPYTAIPLDSQEVGMLTVLNAGTFTIGTDDTLYLWFKLITGFGTETEFLNTVDSVFGMPTPAPPSGSCCDLAGDANNNGAVNIADAIFLINRVFGSPAGPKPPCCEEGDANGNGSVNIADAIYIINRVFGNPAGPAPICGPVGMTCGA